MRRRYPTSDAKAAITDFVSAELDRGESLTSIIKFLRPIWSEPEALVSQDEVEQLIAGVLYLRAKQSREAA